MADDPVQRRLAAILAADVAGYSRLMGQDEEATLAALTAHRTEFIEPCITAHRGRLVKTTGDGLLAEFASAVDAVRCAAAFQEGVSARNAGAAAGPRLDFRIGVNLGDIIVQDGDVYGDGVNVAARLEEIAQPGSICVSGTVFEQVDSRLDLAFDDLGERRLKNIARAVRVYAVMQPAVGPAAGSNASQPLPLPERPSIAVLPFQNMSGDPEQEYFADGISEDIITDLSKISGLFIIARNSSFVYKGKPVSIRQVGRELGVRCVLEGSVRKAGNRVRINAQLIDATDDSHLWAERYDGGLDDIFALQDEVTQKVVAALEVTLTAAERSALTTTPTADVGAYDLLLRARQYFSRFTPEANAEARRMLEEAVDRDSDFAEAMALLSACWLAVWNQGWSDDPVTSLDQAGVLAQRAVELAPENAACRHALGHAAVWQRRHDLAVAEIDRAVALDPNNARAHFIRAMILTWVGRPAEAIPAVETAMRLDPNSAAFNLWARGQARYHLGDFAGAEADTRQSALLNPHFMPANLYLAATRVRLGRLAEAKAAMADCVRASPAMSETLLRGYVPYRRPEDLEMLLADARAAGLPT